MMKRAMTEMLKKGRMQGRRAVAMVLLLSMLSGYLPAPAAARAASAYAALNGAQVLVDGMRRTDIGSVTYSRESDGDYEIDASSQRVRVGMEEEIAFTGSISAPQGETLSWVRVDVYDADTAQPYTEGAEYYREDGLQAQHYDLADIPAMTIGGEDAAYPFEEGGRYVVMLCVGISGGGGFADTDGDVDDAQGPAILLDVRYDPETCDHPHSSYRYVLHASGETRYQSYGDPLTHQIEPLYERWCGLCDSFLMNIWGQGRPAEHEISAYGLCSLCGYAPVEETEQIDVEVLNVQALIDALPTTQEASLMESDEYLAAYAKTQEAYEAYLALSEEQQAVITGIDRVEALFGMFNAGVATLAATSGSGWRIENSVLYITGRVTSLPDGSYYYIDVQNGGELALSGSTDKLITVRSGGKISSGDFTATAGSVQNYGTIAGGSFSKIIDNYSGTITGGTFYREVRNDGTITGGTFNAKVVNDGTISNARFNSGASLSGGNPQSVIHQVNGANIALAFGAALPGALGDAGEGKVWCGSNGLPVSGNVPLKYTSYIAKTQYTVSIGGSSNGMVTANRDKAIQGETITLTIAPDTGYALSSLTVNGEDVAAQVADGAYSFAMPEGSVTVTATFEAIDYVITVSESENGAVGADKETAIIGEEVTLTVTPDKGYVVNSLTVNGEDVTAQVADGAYSFTMPAGNMTVTATFKAIDYVITVSESENGAVGADKETAIIGEEVTLTVTPDKGYVVNSLTVNGEDVTAQVADGAYSFTMPAGDVTVTATFKAIIYGITIDESENGTVGADKENAIIGEEVTLTITPDTGYALSSLTVNGEDVTDQVVEDKYSFTMPAGDVTVSAEFEMADYGIAISSVTGGTVAAQATAHYGETVALTVSEEAGYMLATILVKDAAGDGVSVDMGNYTFIMPASDVTVEASFAPFANITVMESENGRVEANATAIIGEEVTLTIMPDIGYALSSLTVNGEDVTAQVADGAYSFAMPAGDVTVSAEFEIADYGITISSVTGGTVTAQATAHHGETVALTVSEEAGYILDEILVMDAAGNGVSVDMGNYIFIMPPSDVTVEAVFIPFVDLIITRDGQPLDDYAEIAAGDVLNASYGAEGATIKWYRHDPMTGEQTLLSEGATYTVDGNAFNNDDRLEVKAFLNSEERKEKTLLYFEDGTYNIRYDIMIGCWIDGPAQAASGTTVNLRLTIPEGYRQAYFDIMGPNDFVEFTGPDADGSCSFTMPKGDVLIHAEFTSGYTIESEWHDMYTLEAPECADAGESVAITPVVHYDGYEIDTITVTGKESGDTYAATLGPDGVRYRFTMPEEGVILSATVKEITAEKVSVISITRNKALADGDSVSVGEKLYCQVTILGGFGVWIADGAEIFAPFDVTVPECDTLKLVILDADDYSAQDYSNPLYAYTFPVSGALPQYTLTIEESDGGTVTADFQTFYEGDFVGLNITPDDGYKLESLTYTEEGGATVSVLGNAFYMPASDVIVRATFAAAQEPVETVLTVIRGGFELSDGDAVYPGDVLTASCEAAASFVWEYNGETVGSGASYTVPGSIENNSSLHVKANDGDGNLLVLMSLLCREAYSVTIADGIEHGSVSFKDGYTSPAESGQWFYLDIQPEDGYVLDTVTVTGENDVYDFDYSDNSFQMPHENVTVYVTFKADEGGETGHNIGFMLKAVDNLGNAVGGYLYASLSGSGIDNDTEWNYIQLAAGAHSMVFDSVPSGYQTPEDVILTVSEQGGLTTESDHVQLITEDGHHYSIVVTLTKAEPETPTIVEIGLQLKVVDENNAPVSSWIVGNADIYAVSNEQPNIGYWAVGEYTLAFAEGAVPSEYKTPADVKFTVNADGSVTSSDVAVEQVDGVYFLVITLEAEEGIYSITILPSEFGTATVTPETYTRPCDLTVTVTPNEGYRFIKVVWYDSEGQYLGEGYPDADNPNVVTQYVAGENLTGELVFESLDAPTYTITIDEGIEHGTVTVDKTTVTENDIVTLTIIPDEGYALEQLTAAYGGMTQDITQMVDSNVAAFHGVTHDMTISATFWEIDAEVVITIVNQNGETIKDGDTVYVGDTLTVSVVPNAPYREWLVNGQYNTENTLEVSEAGTIQYCVYSNVDDYYASANPVKTVTLTAVEKAAEPTYTITIPASVNLNTQGGLIITASDIANLPEGSSIVVSASSQNGGYLVMGENRIGYTYDSELAFAEAGSQSLDMAIVADDVTGKPVGEYMDTLSFTASVSDGN